MAAVNEYFERDAACLIEKVTPFKKDEENFMRCLQFVLSHFQYHKFLDVNEHDVRKRIDGLHEKLVAHSQLDKARALSRLTSKLLEGNSEKHSSHNTTAYSMVSLLFHLANKPTSFEYVPQEASNGKNNTDADFDWGAYLLEGEETFSPSSNSDWSDIDDEIKSHPILHTEVQSLDSKDWSDIEDEKNDSGLHLELKSHSFKTILPTVIKFEDVSNDRLWLKNNIMTQYWNEPYALSDDVQAHRFNQLHYQWTKYSEDANRGISKHSKPLITEYQLMREILWILQGIGTSYVFKSENGKHKISSDVGLSHLTEGSLHTLLEDVLKFSDIVLKLQSFVYNIYSSSDNLEDRNHTYFSYASELAKYIRTWRTTLCNLERELIKQDGVVSIMSLLNSLSDDFAILSALEKIHVLGVESANNKTNFEKALTLLNVLYNTLVQVDIDHHHQRLVKLLLQLFVNTFRAYANIIDIWIKNGILEDRYEEFIFKRQNEIHHFDHLFWSKSVVSRITEASQEKKFVTSELFLSKFFLEKLSIIGRSTELLHHLEEHSSNCRQFFEDEDGFRMGSFYSQFVRGLVQLMQLNENIEENLVVNQSSKDNDKPFFTSNQSEDSLKRHIHNISLDPLLVMNFRSLSCGNDGFQKISLLQDEITNRSLDKLNPPFLMPVGCAIQSVLDSLVQNAYAKSCKALMLLLKNNFGLMGYLSLMRSVYLLEDGETMYNFYSELFNKLQHDEYKKKTLLGFVSKDALLFYYPQSLAKLSINLYPGECSRLLDIINEIELTIEIPWPIDIIITNDVQKTYNRVFKFFLQLKWAKYSLDQLRFTDFNSTSNYANERAESVKINRIYLMKMKLCHFVNGIHDYLMVKILHTTGIELNKQLSAAEDLEEAIAIYSAHVEQLHLCCLFHEKMNMVRNAILWLLNFALEFQRKWNSGSNNFGQGSLTKMEDELAKWFSFLESVHRERNFPETSLSYWLCYHILPYSSM